MDNIWLVILGVGIGSYLIRFSFLGLVGDRPMPDWLTRHLRYAAVGILPGIALPPLIWPNGTDLSIEAPRIAAGLATVVVGYVTKNVLGAIAAGGLAYVAMVFLV